MKKIKLLFAALLSMMAWTGVMAADPDLSEYEAAKAAIQDDAVYRIKTEKDGTAFYVTTDGTLTSVKDNAGAFIITLTSGGHFGTGFRIDSGTKRFTNGPLNSDKAVLNTGNYATSTNDRTDWERQILFLNSEDKFAIRTCNTEYKESSWEDAGRTFWSWTVENVDLIPCYSYNPAYLWEFEKDDAKTQQWAAYNTATSWITTIQSSNGLVTDPEKYTSNAKESSEGTYGALLDGDYTTYFHSQWSGTGPSEDHYLQAELTESVDKLYFYFKRRSQNTNNRPTTIVISASNDGTNFQDVTTINSGLPTDANVIDYLSDAIDLGAKYKYVRFSVPSTNNGAANNGHVFFTFSEFYIFPSNSDIDNVITIYKTLPTSAFDLTDNDVTAINNATTALLSTLIKVTYELWESDGTEPVTSIEVEQNKNSDVNVPATLTSSPLFYDYAVIGTIGSQDCTIKVVRTLKAGYVGKLADLSNDKAYTITCDRGKFLTKDDYLASTAHSSLSSAEPSAFAVINYEDNYYLYSVVDKKFVTNTGALAGDLLTDGFHGTFDAIQMTPMTVPYFFWYFKVTEETKYGLNTNGNDPYGYVINNWMNADPGNQYYMVEAADFDPTDAIAALEAYFHPAYTVTYVVKDTNDNVIFTSEPQGTTLGSEIKTLPDDFKRAFYTYNEDEVDVTITDVTTTVEFTATWTGPFEISADFATAHWYDMAMRGIWYVTSAVKDAEDGNAYKTQEANTMGLVEDSYQWAFLGDGYKGFKIINKAEGDGKSFGWTDEQQTNAGIPTVMDDSEGNHFWKIVPSTNTSVPAGSFCLNVPGTALYINQYGGKGGKVKFWNSTSNIGDDGSAFTVFDVPSNFASFVVDEIAPALDATGYFAFTDAVKAEIGWDPAYKTDCPFATYKSLKEKLAAVDMNDFSNFVLPENGIYTLKNKNYGTYIGIDPSDLNLYGNYQSTTAAKQIVKLTKVGEKAYTISLEGVFAPATVERSAQVTANEQAATYTLVIPVVGYGAFQANTEEDYSCLHCEAGGSIVGWVANADASLWQAEKATSIELTIGQEGFATTYLPFAVSVPENVTAYTGKLTDAGKGYFLKLNKIEGTIPAETGVILEGAANTYVYNIAADVDKVDNDLKGTCVPTYVTSALTLQIVDSALGFYTYIGGDIPANKAYLELPGQSLVKVVFGDATAIKGIQFADENNTIFNLAGQRINKAQKGIYIINGKKAVVK